VAGMMRSFDQYGNVMLEDTFERHVVGNVYADERVSPSTSAPSSHALNLHLISAIFTHVLAFVPVEPSSPHLNASPPKGSDKIYATRYMKCFNGRLTHAMSVARNSIGICDARG
jgi:hypothetical protein